MNRKKHNKVDSSWTGAITRKMTPLALSSILLAGGASVMGIRGCAPDKNHTEIGDTTRPVDQDEINAHYAKIYDAIALAKQNAEDAGKPLAILVAGGHTVRDSMLVDVMTMNAAKRCGVSMVMQEMKEGDVHYLQSKITNIIQRRDEYFKQEMADASDPVKKQIADGITIPAVINGFIAQSPDGWRDMPNNFAVGIAAELSHMTQRALDPLHDLVEDEHGADPAAINSEREEEMKRVLSDIHTSFIAPIGGDHVPELARTLEKNNFDVLVIDGRNMQLPSNIHPLQRQRDEELNQRRDMHVVIEGASVSMGEAYGRAVVASLTHQYTKGELSKEEYSQAAEAIAHSYSTQKANLYPGH